MTIYAFRHLHVLVFSVFSFSLPHGAVGNSGGQNCIGNSWSHNGYRNVPSALGNNDAICSTDQKTRLFFDGQRCRLTYRQCDLNNNCRDYHPAGPTKNCVSGGLAILQQNGDIKVYSNGAAFWWQLSAETGVFGESFKPPVRYYYNKSKMIMGDDGNIETKVNGEVNSQLVWSYTSRTRTAGFKCQGSTLSTLSGRDAVFGGDTTNRPNKVGYCTDSKRFGIFFDRETCQLKFCRTTTGSTSPCNEIYLVSPQSNQSPCYGGRAELLYSGKLAIYRDQSSSSQTILSAAQLPGDFYQSQFTYDSSELTVSSTSIEINIMYNSMPPIRVWKFTYNGGTKEPFTCLANSLSSQVGRETVFGDGRDKVGYCSPDKTHGIYFDKEYCQLHLCKTVTSNNSNNLCNVIYDSTPRFSSCLDGKAELNYDGDLAIYGISTIPRWRLSQDGKFGDKFSLMLSNFQISAKLSVVSSGIITIVAQTQVWSSDSGRSNNSVRTGDSVGTTLPYWTPDVRTMDCVDNDYEMQRLRNQSCEQHLRNQYNYNRHNACRDLINGQAVKNLCRKSCYTGACNHMQPRNSCYDSPKTAQFGISSCESQINNCFGYVDNGMNTLVRDYCRYTCRVDMDCNPDLL